VLYPTLLLLLQIPGQDHSQQCYDKIQTQEPHNDRHAVVLPWGQECVQQHAED